MISVAALLAVLIAQRLVLKHLLKRERYRRVGTLDAKLEAMGLKDMAAVLRLYKDGKPMMEALQCFNLTLSS